MKHILLSLFVLPIFAFAQQPQASPSTYWQQRVKYVMKADVNVQTNKLTGTQHLDYWNNSPDTLKRVFYHLYWNAFQPNSMMDARSRRQGTVVLRKAPNGNDMVDWDSRVKDRILNLKKDEIGYENVTQVKMNGRLQKAILHETILEVVLDKPILPKTKVTFDLTWDSQVPLQVRRSGRDNPNTKVRYTMTQWYPKMCEYDFEGWHPTPYVAREFYGVWGDYDVTINIDKSYVLGGSGNIVNTSDVGHGYDTKSPTAPRPVSQQLSWHFVAPNVHDFAWAADPDYKHLVRHIPNGPTINVLYKNNSGTEQEDARWKEVADAAVVVFPFIKKTFGDYPYPQYSFIHGGDGGMEYPNCTMIAGPGIGTAFHEWMHTWYQMQLGTNESEYPWMDEGFTEWATGRVEDYYDNQMRRSKIADPREKHIADSVAKASMQKDVYNGYYALVRSKLEEPLTTHADQYNTNFAYSEAAYSKGGVFMEQLGYVVGAEVLDKILLEYYRKWHFKHPNANEFIRVAEKVSGLQLDWYRGYFVNTIKTIDYKIDTLYEAEGKTRIGLRNLGQMPMPIDVRITFRDGTTEMHYIPMYLMFGQKQNENPGEKRIVYEEWKWTHPTYEVETSHRLTDIISIEIDPSQRLADVDRKNNRLDLKW